MIRVTRSAVIDAPIERRLGGAARLQQPHRLASGGRPSRRSRAASRPTRSAACAISRCATATTSASSCWRSRTASTSPPTASSTRRCRCAATWPRCSSSASPTASARSGTGSRPSTRRAGREREFADMVGDGVYEGGFEGLRAYLRRSRHAPDRPAAGSRAVAAGETLPAQGVVVASFGGPEVLRHQSLPARPPGPGEVRIRQTAIGVNYIDVYVRSGLYRLIEPPAVLGMEAAGVVVDVGDGVAHLLPGDRVAYACAPPGAYVTSRTMPAEQVVVLPDDVDDETAADADAQGNDRRVPAASHASRARGGDGPGACGGGRRRPLPVPVGQGARRAGDRHRLERRQGATRARERLRPARSLAATIASRRRCWPPPAGAART